ncbi:MAG: 50S ribosomal protein L15 [bacterium]|nr:50S ribosomal protein L15 [bacterium]MCX7917428.1 50S ribosomal protein L15 [bacterium]MDW8163323.1 50S ribosomal protein L15 [Candidatus Omnitrophota bacterium]
MKLNQLKPPFGAKHKKKRLGRGDSSGHGGTSTRGHKGHKARSGYRLPFNFEGGQMPLFRRLPKRGFTHIKEEKIEIVNLNQIEKLFNDGEEVTIDKLKEKGIIKKGECVRILGEGNLTKKLIIYGHHFSKKAKEKIEKVGGKINIIEEKKNV